MTVRTKEYRKSIDPYLDEVLLKWGTDKVWSEYHITYGELYKDSRLEVKRVLEVGIGSFEHVPDNFNGIRTMYPYYKPGGSLRAWRDYFPNATIHGIDIGTDCKFDEERLKTFIFDSTDWKKCYENLKGFEYDIIIDDGSHLSLSQLLTFKNLVQFLKKGGRYFIEDLGGSPGYLVGENSTYYKPELVNGIFEPELIKTAKQYNLNLVEGRYHPVIIQ